MTSNAKKVDLKIELTADGTCVLHKNKSLYTTPESYLSHMITEVSFYINMKKLKCRFISQVESTPAQVSHVLC